VHVSKESAGRKRPLPPTLTGTVAVPPQIRHHNFHYPIEFAFLFHVNGGPKTAKNSGNISEITANYQRQLGDITEPIPTGITAITSLDMGARHRLYKNKERTPCAPCMTSR
jgi:hypothetical protein